LDLDFSPEPDPPGGTTRPLVLVLHGLEGSARRGYALVAYRELAARGIRSVGLNFRSCSGEPNRLPRAYHSGDTGDLAFVLDRLRERCPSPPLGVLGFSLGGNVLLKFLGERGEAARELITAAVAVSVPYDLAEGSRRLEGWPMGRVYSTYFLRSLRRKTRLKATVLQDRIPLNKALCAATLREFDDLATAPLHGFDSAAQYYEHSSSQHFLSRVKVPTLLLHAGDDPFLPHVALPHAAIHDNPAITSGVVTRGGHVGFVEGSLFSPRFWAESEAARFMETLLIEDTRDTP
jgi:predicted alpha/beta-fold hydrolase